MARIATCLTVFILIIICVGCSMDNGGALLIPPGTQDVIISPTTYDLANLSEVDLAEQVALNRQEYRQNLSLLHEYYVRTGNNRKLDMVEKELNGLSRVHQYAYTGGILPSKELKARMAIPEATAMFIDAEKLQQDSGLMPIVGIKMPYVRSDNLLRFALERYIKLIREYPSSDKIDDAAFNAGYIHEHFRDYGIALEYYQRAYSYDLRTPHPARFKAAYMLDKRLHRKSEAVEVYQEALEIEGVLFPEWREFAEQRIQALTNTAPGNNS